jgi:MFS family permease
MSIPLIATLIHKYFPRGYRGRANSILYSANYVGTAISSLSILLISKFGWRNIYNIMGGFGIFVAVIANLLLITKKPSK